MVYPFYMLITSDTRRPIKAPVRHRTGAQYLEITQRHKGDIFEAADIRQYVPLRRDADMPEILHTHVSMKEHIKKVEILLDDSTLMELPNVKRINIVVESEY